jgi:PAS domain S-box-containing protein
MGDSGALEGGSMSSPDAAPPAVAPGGFGSEETAELAQLYRTAPVGMCLMDRDLRFIRVNERLAEINGKPIAEHIGRTLREVIPDLAEQVEASYRRVLDSGEPVVNAEVWGATPADPDRERCWLVSHYPLESPEGVVTAISTVVQDITDRKEADRALRDSEERLRRLLETTQVVPWEGNAETLEFTYVGPQAVALLGYPVEEWYEPNFWPTHIHPEDREAAIEFCKNASRESRAHDFEYRLMAADGRSVWVHDIVNIDAIGCEPRALRGFMIDISSRKSVEEELARHRLHLEELVNARTEALERTHEKLRRSERLASIGTFAAGIAHQINNPLGGILLAARSAQNSNDDPAAHSVVLADVVSGANRCGRIVKSLLRFAQEDVLGKAPADLNTIVRSAVGQVRDHGAEVELRLADALPPLSLNETAIGEVVVNLLQNAVDAGADHIVLQTRSTRDATQFTVCDDGKGIEPQDLQRVFDPFVTRREGRGTGLGLSIAHRLVAGHGGTIDLESEPGRGTTATVNLPSDASGDGENSHR